MSIEKSVDALVIRLQRRELIGSRQTALETSQLLYRYVSVANFSTIEDLLEQIKAIGRRLVAANPKELAVGNIVRKVLRLIKEEYKVAYNTHIGPSSSEGFDFTSDPSQGTIPPETPMPPTPGIHAPANHYLSNQFPATPSTQYFPHVSGHGTSTPSPPASRSASVSGTPRAGSIQETSLSNFIQTRHSRVQLERAGSSIGISVLEAEMGRMKVSGSSGGGSGSNSPVPDRHRSLPGHSRSSFTTPPPEHSPNPLSPNQAVKDARDAFARKVMLMKPVLVDAIREVVDEVETTSESCAKGAREHVHSSEIILTLGYSRTVEAFLKAAWKDRKFTVIVAATAPSLQGHQMAQSLSSHNIPTILIPDSSIYAVMTRVTKLIIGAHSVLANGGIYTISGSLMAALSAKAHSTPVVVVSGQFKFSPAWKLEDGFGGVDFGDPGRVLGGQGRGKGEGEGKWLDKVEVGNPFYDYLKPDLINLFITNDGDHSPAYVYKIVNEAYDEEDLTL